MMICSFESSFSDWISMLFPKDSLQQTDQEVVTRPPSSGLFDHRSPQMCSFCSWHPFLLILLNALHYLGVRAFTCLWNAFVLSKSVVFFVCLGFIFIHWHSVVFPHGQLSEIGGKVSAAWTIQTFVRPMPMHKLPANIESYGTEYFSWLSQS